MDCLLAAFLLSVIAFVRPVKKANWEGYLSVANTNALRGIMAIAIMLHHLSEHSSSGRFSHLLNHLGYLLVAVFFFLSGYGLMVQFSKKGKEYVGTIWKKRVLFFAIVLLLDTLLYVGVNLLYGKRCAVLGFFFSFVNGHPLAGSSWYLIVQIYFYIFFWCIFRYVAGKWKRIFCMALLVGVADLLFFFAGYPSFWIFSNFGFVLGMLWGQEKEKIDLLLARYYFPAVICAMVLFLLFSFLPSCLPRVAYLPCRMISAPLFAALVILVLCKVSIVGCFWSTVSLISLEVFLLHALVYRFFRSNIVRVQNDFLWATLTIACTVLLAIPAHLLNRKIRSWLR